MNKKQIAKKVSSLAYRYRNIKEDFSGVVAEDVPDEVKAELKDLMSEMKDLREQLGK